MNKTTTFTVTGMKCGGCENNLIEKLTALGGVVGAFADHKENHVSVEFDSEKIDIEEIEDVIITAGFCIE